MRFSEFENRFREMLFRPPGMSALQVAPVTLPSSSETEVRRTGDSWVVKTSKIWARIGTMNRAEAVAPIGNWLYRGLAIRDTADCQSAPHRADCSWADELLHCGLLVNCSMDALAL